MYGHRARIGVLVPSGIITIEPEFNMVVPEGVTCHYHRFRFLGGGDNKAVLNDLKAAVDYVADASELIMHVRPSVMVMAGTGVSFIGGYGYDKMLIQKIKEKNGNLPATTTSTAVIAAFQSLGIKKVSIAMPYIEEVARAAVKFVEDNGTGVVNARWLNKSGYDISLIPEETLYELAMEVNTHENDALFISCTALHTFGLIQKLEKDLKKPVITSNQATIWHAMRVAGINDKISGYGRLLFEK